MALEPRSKRRAPRPPHRILKFFLLILTGALFFAGTYGYHVYSQLKNAVDKTYEPLDGHTLHSDITGNDPISFLLLGTDTGAFGRKDRGNSDTMIVVTISPDKKRTTMTSIPRDTMAQIYDENGKATGIQKINAAYNIGNSKAAVKTVEKLLNIPIDYYVTINMAGLEKIVNAVGGVDVNVPFSWTDSNTGGQHFKKGPAHLNGSRALAYARMRYEDPEGDYGRQKRQQEVIESIVKSALSVKTLGNYQEVFDSMSNSLRMNLTFDDVLTIAEKYNADAKTIKSSQLKGVGAYIGDGAYEIPSTEALQKASDKIRTEMGLEKETLDNVNTQQNAKNVNFDWESGNNPTYTIFDDEGAEN